MINQYTLTNTTTLMSKEAWKSSYYIFLMLSLMSDILVIFIVSWIIVTILRSHICDDYIKIHRGEPPATCISVISIKTLETTKAVLKKGNESLLFANPQIDPKALRHVSKHSLPKHEKALRIQRKLPKILEDSEELRCEIPGRSIREEQHKTEKDLKLCAIEYLDDIDKIEALVQQTSEALSKSENEDHSYHHNRVSNASLNSSSKIIKQEEQRLLTNALHGIGKMNPGPDKSKIQIAKENKTKRDLLKIIEAPKYTSTPKTSPTRIEKVPESQNVTKASICSNAKRQEEVHLSASNSYNKKARDEMVKQTSDHSKNKAKQGEVESLSSEDYSALGVKDGIIPVGKSEYQRKLIAIAMRCKIKEIQAKTLKTDQEKRILQIATQIKSKSYPTEGSKEVDLRTLSSGMRNSAKLESEAFEVIRRESVSDNQTPQSGIDSPKQQALEKQLSMSIANKSDENQRKGSKDESKSPLTSQDKQLLQIYGELSEEDLIFEASSIVIPECGKSEDEAVIDRLEPIRRRWKIPRLESRWSSEPTQTLSTGGPIVTSPWDPSYRVMSKKRLSEIPTETFSSGESKINIPNTQSEIAEETAFPTLAAGEGKQDDDADVKPSTLPSQRMMKHYNTAKDLMIPEKQTSVLPSTTETFPSGDLRAVSPLYRYHECRNRRRLQGIQSRVRRFEEQKINRIDEEDSAALTSSEKEPSISISSGDSDIIDTPGASLPHPEIAPPVIDHGPSEKRKNADFVTAEAYVSDISQQDSDSKKEWGKKLTLTPTPSSQSYFGSKAWRAEMDKKVRGKVRSKHERKDREKGQKVQNHVEKAPKKATKKPLGKSNNEESNSVTAQSDASGSSNTNDSNTGTSSQQGSEPKSRPRLTKIIDHGPKSKKKVVREDTPPSPEEIALVNKTDHVEEKVVSDTGKKDRPSDKASHL